MYTSLLLITCSVVAVISLNQPNDDVFESWGLTEYKVSKLRYTWTIKNFSFYEQIYSEKLESPYFFDGINNQYKWNLVLYPKGYYDQNVISLYINLNSKTINRADYKLAILDKNHHEIVVGKGTDRFNQNFKGIDRFTKLDFILNEVNGILVNDQLTIFCEINATIGSENFSGKFKQLPPRSNIVQDFTSLFKTPVFTDVTLSAGEKEFTAHKAILAIRSHFFKDIFERDTNLTRIEIFEVDPVVVNEMLRYIYTDVVLNLPNLVFDLLDVAVTYELDGLKKICENNISANLTIANAAEFFILGDMHNAYDVKSDAKNLIFAHIAEVVRTPGFQSMIQTHPDLLQELLIY